MARMTSFAGELEVKFLKVHRIEEQLVIEAELGVWDSQIYFQPQDAIDMFRLMLNPSTLSYFLLLPLACLKIWLFRR
jgi:hypothetical protein